MTRAELEAAQWAGRVTDLSFLVARCANRYVECADLVEYYDPVIDALRSLDQRGGYVLNPLFDTWDILAARFVEERFEDQLGLFTKSRHEPVGLWNRYLHWGLFHELLRSNECVRNVLRAVKALPAREPAWAARALRNYVVEMKLPPWNPLWLTFEL